MASILNLNHKIANEHRTDPAESDYVTIVQCDKPINKQFINGQKRQGLPITYGLAYTVPVPNIDTMVELLKEVSEHSNRVIILGFIPDKVGADSFQLVTKDQEDIDNDKWARIKNNFRFSSWCLFDRDVTGDPRFDGASAEEWFLRMNALIPGFSGTGGILVPSNSNRVEGFESNSFHFIAQCVSTDYLPDIGKKLMLKAWSLGMGIEKLSKGGAKLKRTLLDCSTFSPERVVYEGRPVAQGLEVKPQEFVLREGNRVDFSSVGWSDSIPKGFSRFGSTVSQDGELSWDTVIETEVYGTLTLQEIHDRLRSEKKVRCQATFRESTSWNGYVGWHKNGEPFLFDNGTGIKYVLSHPTYTIPETSILNGEVDTNFKLVLPDEIIFPDDCFGELSSALYKIMWKPNKMTAFASASSVLAYLSGGKYRGINKGDTLNSYLLVTGGSGIGKGILVDGPNEVLEYIFMDNNELFKIASSGVANKIKTDAGLDNMFVDLGNRPDILFIWDEFGIAMQSISSRRSDWMATVLDAALELWPVAHQKRAKRRLASDKGEIPLIYGPHLNIAGASTESTLVDGVSWSFWTSGKGPRILILPAEPYREQPVRAPDTLRLSGTLTKHLRQMFAYVSESDYKGGLAEKRVYQPEKVFWDVNVEDYLYDISCRTYGPIGEIIRNRAVILVKKEAMKRAIVNDPIRPRVTLDMAEWADIIVNYSHDYQEFLFAGNVGENLEDRVEKAIINYMESAEMEWVPQGNILGLSLMRKLQPYQRINLLNYLSDPNQAGVLIRTTDGQHRGRATVLYKLAPKYR